MIKDNLKSIVASLPKGVELIAVSKTKPIEDIIAAYEVGQRAFGENKVQEMSTKFELLPKNIEWHMIGHLQTNKVKYIVSFVTLIHSVDSLKLLEVINKEALKNNRTIDCLLEIYIAKEESKFGLDEAELEQLLQSPIFKSLNMIRIRGFMGMASYTDNTNVVRQEFKSLKDLFSKTKSKYFSTDSNFNILSMGMSGDYPIAIEEGSNMVRIGSNIFGERNYKKD